MIGRLSARLKPCPDTNRAFIGLVSGYGFSHTESWQRRTALAAGNGGLSSQRGITLIEMVVVLAIIGLIAGLSFPAITAGLDSVRMVSATDSVAAFLNAAVTRAQRRQQPVEIIVSPKDNTLAMYSNDFTRELTMPDGILVEGVLPAINASPEMPRSFVFMPGGAVPGIGIQLASKRNAHRVVRLDPMTGFPRVESVNTK